MFDYAATSTLEYRPAFGRRAGAFIPAFEDAAPSRSVDAITAELRKRVLGARRIGLLPASVRPAATR